MHALNRTFKREDTFARLQLLRNAPFLETRVYKMLINIQICGAHVVMKISVGCGEESRCCNLLVAVFSNIPFSCRGALLYYVDILFLIMSAPPPTLFSDIFIRINLFRGCVLLEESHTLCVISEHCRNFKHVIQTNSGI